MIYLNQDPNRIHCISLVYIWSVPVSWFIIFPFFFFFFLLTAAWSCGILVAQQGSNQGPWQLKGQVLTTGQPGNSQFFFPFIHVIDLWKRPGQDFLDGSASKESACNAGDTGDANLIPGLGRSPGGRNGNPLQYSYLKNPMDRGAWPAIPKGCKE